ncbi:MAG TPA: FAD/NAD(P)-binding protein [Ignavibacteriaceae bacterium]|nr:FAD/NAD(P)-binding protein [Ignavibacteriaceae bacterium]
MNFAKFAYSDNPGHFVEWVNKKGIEASEGDYLPRKLYREYIHKMFREALEGKGKKVSTI